MFFLHILILYHLLEEVIFTLYYLYTTTKETMPVINLNKLATFFHLMGRAEELAEYCEMNIDIKTTGSLFGVLKLQSEYIMMNQDTNIRIREILNELTLKSEQFSITTLEDTFEMEYWFKLFDIVEKEE